MAESLAVVGLIAAVLQFIDFGTKVMTRLNDFHAQIDAGPETFREVNTWLPLLLNTVTRAKKQAEAGHLDKDTQRALIPAIEGCCLQVEILNSLLVKILPTSGDSLWRRRLKALSSLRQEKKVQQITAKVLEYTTTLIYHEVTGYSKADPVGLRNNRDYEAVEDVDPRTFEQWENILGKEHTDTLGSANHLRITPQITARETTSQSYPVDAGPIHNGDNVGVANVVYGGSQIFHGGPIQFWNVETLSHF